MTIYDLCMLGFDDGAQTAKVLALTSSGTYLRVLAQDLGEVVGVGGFALALRRTRIGRFSVADALGMGDIDSELFASPSHGVLNLEEALAGMPGVELGAVAARLAANGNQLRLDQVGRFRAYGESRLLGVYEGREGTARPVVDLSERGQSMKRHVRLEEVEAAPLGGRVVAIGVFDGVHRGHQSIIAEAVGAAARTGGRATVVTFYPHPDTVLRPEPRVESSHSAAAEGRIALGTGH